MPPDWCESQVQLYKANEKRREVRPCNRRIDASNKNLRMLNEICISYKSVKFATINFYGMKSGASN
ncbi:hypothetical protein CWI37_1533p0010 [Hamiltosporidium tvaerminnensis]|uniref:Uncharacterized protein n=1 Tax=Hamiltosporidium tvaerminnensis TaxID=1176355 RepID=A0A4Q9KVN1_9MICR|nr:hypothetical protein CWI37_1533p0010 [Hamiltosporidium tvaerminnensis]